MTTMDDLRTTAEQDQGQAHLAEMERACFLTLTREHAAAGMGAVCHTCGELWPCRVLYVCYALGRERGWLA